MSRWGNALPNRDEQLETKRKAIIREAARFFNRRGSHGTSLDDVAERLGVTKAALYRYVPSKQDLLYACHEEAMEIARESMDQGEASGRTGLEKIQIGMSTYLREMIGAMGVPVLILEENALTGAQAKVIIGLRDEFEKRMRRLVEEGIADGSILPLNPKIAIFMLLGAVHWVTKWYSPEGPWTAADVADALIEMATRGLAAKPSDRLSATLHD
ncbi:TetR/AcrR family transcriptional regulator [Phreatobacter aquaticus]|jgi:TetR/AcrR family transcriptional regulator|uniref:TetR/AcrR family transcriptional regulator n=1 Tax=Phreatobacter aquaticus TaxID=2570229 RepID=A0A4D7QEX8_9HYPH|nr:TetR/AcrR family transcriptional regulator [Phreatobacter aquaticus]QCK85375.1 TetR/AcrR family transcriptional regulator [Phreatobacter aquaticus]